MMTVSITAAVMGLLLLLPLAMVLFRVSVTVGLDIVLAQRIAVSDVVHRFSGPRLGPVLVFGVMFGGIGSRAVSSKLAESDCWGGGGSHVLF